MMYQLIGLKISRGFMTRHLTFRIVGGFRFEKKKHQSVDWCFFVLDVNV